MRTRRRFSILILLVLCALPARADLSGTESALLQKLHGESMMQTVRDLCAPRFAGRRAGSEGCKLSAEYLAHQFRSIGLETLPGKIDFAQTLTMRYSLVSDVDQIRARLAIPLGGVTESFGFEYPYYYGCGGIDKKAPIAFAGYGVSAPEQGHDDYATLDARGKIVLLLAGGPKGVRGVSDVRKMLTAYEHGAIGCLLIGKTGETVDWGTNGYGLASPIADFPTVVVDRKLAERIVGQSGRKLVNLEAVARSGAKPVSTGLGVTAELTVPQVYDPARPTQNLMGVLPGADPDLKGEYVIVSAHYDHLGQDGVLRYNGADDDASGVAAMLSIARAMAAMPERPKRTVLFIAFTGEEGGLTGSNYFAEHPPVPLDRIKGMLQMDMVGIGDRKRFEITGGQSFPEPYKVIAGAAGDLGEMIVVAPFRGASDNLALARKKVPAFMILTAGDHPHYHDTSDLPETLNPGVLEDTGRLIALTAWRLADR